MSRQHSPEPTNFSIRATVLSARDATTRARRIVVAGLLASLLAAAAPAAYFHESHRPGMLWLSDPALKRGFVVQETVPTAILPRREAAQIVDAQPAQGLFEQPNGPKMPEGQCQGDEAKVRRCEQQWESKRLAQGKRVVARSASTLTLTPKAGVKLVLTDWENCSPEGECDGERFLYLGPLGRAAYQAVEIDYEHDSPSLLLFDSTDGKVIVVHYGSEATFLNPAETLLFSAEDLNDATSLIVTRLDGDGPEIELQCLGTRTETSSFGVAFKRWNSDSSFDVALVKAGRRMAARLERGADGAWTLRSQAALQKEGFECRQRGPAPKASLPARELSRSPWRIRQSLGVEIPSG
jgi:hypothetical protein